MKIQGTPQPFTMEDHENEGKTGHMFFLSLSHYKIQCDNLDPIQQEHGAQPLSAQWRRPSYPPLASMFFSAYMCSSAPKPSALTPEGPFLGITGVPQMWSLFPKQNYTACAYPSQIRQSQNALQYVKGKR